MKALVTGTGRMGKAILNLLAQVYPGETGIHSRDMERAKKLIEELHIDAKAVDAEEAFDAPIIIHTLWYNDVLSWVERHKEQLKGKILVDITNPFNETFDDFVTDYDTSSAEEIQKLIPETKVVGAFKNTYW